MDRPNAMDELLGTCDLVSWPHPRYSHCFGWIAVIERSASDLPLYTGNDLANEDVQYATTE